MKKKTKVFYISDSGRLMEHSFGYAVTLSYARQWFRESIVECRGLATMTLDQKRNTPFRFLRIENTVKGEQLKEGDYLLGFS